MEERGGEQVSAGGEVVSSNQEPKIGSLSSSEEIIQF